MKYFILLLLSAISISANSQAGNRTKAPLRIAVAGMSHGHIGFLLNGKMNPDLDLVGIYEPNTEMAQRYAKQFNFDPALLYTDLQKMLDATKPEAVVAFGSTLEHLAVVEHCAPMGIHVMVEKPLATTVKDAEKMRSLAEKNNIFLLTDYETSWYPSNEKAYQLVKDSAYVGIVRKVVVHDGHEGPKEINVSKEFFAWLTDPVENGAGALFDFGCYGANLMTWIMGNEKPTSVTAVTRQFKPNIYPKVDDDATIIVSYPSAECIIQASWNWPFGRKDIEIYGDSGYVINVDSKIMRLRHHGMRTETVIQVSPEKVPVHTDPFSYLYDVIRGKIKVPEYGPYSLANNVIVVKILAAARQSAKSGKAVKLD